METTDLVMAVVIEHDLVKSRVEDNIASLANEFESADTSSIVQNVMTEQVAKTYREAILRGINEKKITAYDALTNIKISPPLNEENYLLKACLSRQEVMDYLAALQKAKKHIQGFMERQQAKTPARLFGSGCSEEQQKITTLTKYLELDTWTPLWASLLVCGISPTQGTQDDTEIPNGAMGLNHSFIPGSHDPFHQARRILEIWNSRENPPLKVRPVDFIAWCDSKGINTEWVTNAAEWKTYASPAVQAPEQGGDEQAQDQELAPHEYAAEQQALFDPLSQAGIAELFDITGVKWASLFERAARNGLDLAREGNSKPHQYNPARVASWLVKCGHLKQGHANNRLANNLPPRSQDSKHSITGELPA